MLSKDFSMCFILWLSSCPYLRKGNISSHDAVTESVSANSGADLDQFYCSRDPSPGGDLSYHVASPLQQDKWTKGYKLWLKATLSPSVMRNTLLGQCFHIRNEKSHKETFDLFQPFLQSLEALQDGEHEKQRRHFIYFLLHQVTVSSNFSILMRKKACQIALLIIHRGYKMIPPCPPFEYAHMWGPSLVSSLKDSSLHSSLRQPAFDLIQTIIVSDAAVLVTSMLDCHTPPIISKSTSFELNDEDEDEGLLFAHDSEEKDDSCWNEFSVQSRFTSREFGEWMSIPMLWHYVFVEIDPLIFPVSFFKVVFWALSRLTMVEPKNSTEMALPVINYLSICAPEISHLFGWKVPSGYDDGGNGKEWKNSIKISTLCTLLMKTFKRMRGRLVATSLNKYPTRVAMLVVCSFSTPAPLIYLPFFLD